VVTPTTPEEASKKNEKESKQIAALQTDENRKEGR